MPSYIAFEGGEGSGKSTQARLLARRIDALFTFEPGATPLGAQLRKILLGPDEVPVGHRTEALLMAADRSQHMEELVRPALAQGRHVVSDRTAYSSMAYQGGARGLGVDHVWDLNQWALAGTWPDFIVLMDLDTDAAVRRLQGDLDRLESEGEDFHSEVASTYRAMAEGDPDRWIVIDALGTITEIEARIWAEVKDRLEP